MEKEKLKKIIKIILIVVVVLVIVTAIILIIIGLLPNDNSTISDICTGDSCTVGG